MTGGQDQRQRTTHDHQKEPWAKWKQRHVVHYIIARG
jgi:hypothetical protein